MNISTHMTSQCKWDKARIDCTRGGKDSSEQITWENAWDRCFQVFLEHAAYREIILFVKCSKSQHKHKQDSML